MLEQIENGQTLMKKKIKIQLKPESTPLIFSSLFDSGNMGKVEIGPNNSICITPAVDCCGSAYEGTSKGWFYFSVSGAPINSKIRLVIKKLSQLSSQSKISQYFKPVYKYSKQEWNRVENAKTFTKQDDTQLQINFQFIKSSEVFFAFTYPFSYSDCETMISKLSNEVKKTKFLYFHDEILIKSPEKRNVHLLTLSSNDGKQQKLQEPMDQYLFPQSKARPNKFKIQKKIIFISARVHPSQAPSSHTLNGLIKFLISKDARAFILRKYYVFKIIPMLNPDGVYHGHHRMDIFNQNLNRYYLDPDPLLQPSAYAVRNLGEYYKSQERLAFYLDLHAHPQKKGNFIYGNSFQNHQDQVESQLFAKVLSMNCIQFDYENSSFAQRHMTMKDKNQNLTKQGCGRVVFQKKINQIYSYTMQCGYTCSAYLNQIVSIEKGHRKFQKHSIFTDELENIKSPYYSGGKKALYFSIRSYQALGKAILVSMLDVFEKNPASRIPNTQYKNLENIKKQISIQITKASTGNNFRIYNIKPNSQQGQKAKIQINSSKTIGSSLKKSLQKNKPILLSSQVLQQKRQSVRQKRQDKSRNAKLRNTTLPRVNFQRLISMRKNISDMSNASKN